MMQNTIDQLLNDIKDISPKLESKFSDFLMIARLEGHQVYLYPSFDIVEVKVRNQVIKIDFSFDQKKISVEFIVEKNEELRKMLMLMFSSPVNTEYVAVETSDVKELVDIFQYLIENYNNENIGIV